MNPIKVIPVCLFIFLSSLTLNAQKKESVFNRIYIIAGYETSDFSNSSSRRLLTDEYKFKPGVAFDLNSSIQFEMNYKYLNGYYFVHSYNNYENIVNGWLQERESNDNADNINSHELNFKTNYFFINKRKLPFYITGEIGLSFQKVENWQNGYSLKYDSLNRYYNENYTSNELYSYNRFLIGPAVGGGVFWNFGRFGIKAECTYSVKFSPFKDRNYKERSFNISLSPFLKL